MLPPDVSTETTCCHLGGGLWLGIPDLTFAELGC